MTRTIAIFSGTVAGVAEWLQPALHRTGAISQQAASFVGIFLTPAAVLALSFGLWRLSADLGWTAGFPIAAGLFSHWIVWLGLAIGLEMTGSLLKRPIAK